MQEEEVKEEKASIPGLRVYFSDIHNGKGARQKYLYACLRECSTGHLAISADMPYCLKAIKDRGWIVANDTSSLTEIATLRAEIDRLREALGPLVKIITELYLIEAQPSEEFLEENKAVRNALTVARAALAPRKANQDKA
jgi:hypothetical protein